MDTLKIREISDDMGFAMKNLLVVSESLANETIDTAVVCDALCWVVSQLLELHEQLDTLLHHDSKHTEVIT